MLTVPNEVKNVPDKRPLTYVHTDSDMVELLTQSKLLYQRSLDVYNSLDNLYTKHKYINKKAMYLQQIIIFGKDENMNT